MSASLGLNTAQRKVIAALLAGKTRQEAAATAKKSLRTVERYLCDERVRSEIAECSRQIMRSAVERLQQAALEAADALVAMATDGAPATAARVAAAKAVLDLAVDRGEVEELREAVAILKDRLNVRGGVQ
jgi:diacylglycerol kinase family enzyme